MDARDVSSVQAILGDIDLLLHIGLPENNFDVMKACLNTKTHYIDTASSGPQWLRKQLSWNNQCRAAGILGIMGLGCDPGFSNIAARYAVDQL
ncbi:saccharopine dehydrogenase NADP-binding domain-containing protein, partial [Peribacillus sp. SIMBA_075]|uniref:saccharopine dehydrogenase NADP-binding domain-containing protein n=1 Tax=Peribacillus sp. SIMBA_075 TaxID=3085813 RepID=UPI0039782347